MSAHMQGQVGPAAGLHWSKDTAPGKGRLPVATAALVIVSASAVLWFGIWKVAAYLASLLA